MGWLFHSANNTFLGVQTYRLSFRYFLYLLYGAQKTEKYSCLSDWEKRSSKRESETVADKVKETHEKSYEDRERPREVEGD